MTKTQTISRENLSEIHKIACPSWKGKLEYYASRDPFKADIVLTDAEVKEMFNASNNDQRKVLTKYLTSKTEFIMDRVTSFETACEVLNISPENKSPYEKLCIIIKALNEGWTPDFTNDAQPKFCNYWWINKSVFYLYATYSNHYTNMYVPAALYLKNKELAIYVADIAYLEYKEFYLGK